MPESRSATNSASKRGRIFSTDARAGIAQGCAIAAAAVLVLHGVLDGTASIGVWVYGAELALAMVLVVSVLLAFLLRLQAKAVGRLHPGAHVVTAIANVQFVVQLRAAADVLGIPSGRGYSGTYYAVAFDVDDIWIVLGSVRPKDIIRIPTNKCTDLTVERVAQGVFMQNCIEIHLVSREEPVAIDLLLLRPLAIAAVPLGRARLDAVADDLRKAIHPV